MKLLSKSAPKVARELIGYELYIMEVDGTLTGGIIGETEAYTSTDAASHSFRGKTPRNEVMYGNPGHIYVYFTYGMHWCMNIVTGPAGDGEAVLIRAIIPTRGIDTMRARRNGRPNHELTNGPAKVCQALGVTGRDNGAEIGSDRFILRPPLRNKEFTIKAHPRIGITRDIHRMWRFTLEDDS